MRHESSNNIIGSMLSVDEFNERQAQDADKRHEEIIRAVLAGDKTHEEIAADFGVTRSRVGQIFRRGRKRGLVEQIQATANT